MQYEMMPNGPGNYELQSNKQVMCAVVSSSNGNYNACPHIHRKSWTTQVPAS